MVELGEGTTVGGGGRRGRAIPSEVGAAVVFGESMQAAEKSVERPAGQVRVHVAVLGGARTQAKGG